MATGHVTSRDCGAQHLEYFDFLLKKMFPSHSSGGVLRWSTLKLLRNSLFSTEASSRSYFARKTYSVPSRVNGCAQLCSMTSVKEPEVETSTSTPKKESFTQLLRNSRFVKSIDPVGKKAEGEILAISGDKIYVDFGSKFYAVVDMPKLERERYVEGAKVIVTVKNLEMTDHFLGARKHISLLEAEAELVGLADSNT